MYVASNAAATSRFASTVHYDIVAACAWPCTAQPSMLAHAGCSLIKYSCVHGQRDYLTAASALQLTYKTYNGING
jgi:hypothetical protein